MSIRKGRLYRLCIRCDKSFCPTGRTNKICEACQIKRKGAGSFIAELMRLQKKINKQNGYKKRKNKM